MIFYEVLMISLPRSHSFSKAKNEVINGFLKSLPVMLGYFPIGFAFGILSAKAGLDILESAMMSLLVFAGSAQLIAVSLLANGAGLMTLVVTTFLVNLRHLLMSAALAPHLGHLTLRQRAFFSFELTDETFALHSINFKKGHKHPLPRILAINIFSHLSWLSSTLLGALSGALLTDLEAWGLDYALPAMFIALLIFQLENLKRLFIAVFSLFFSIFLFQKLGGHWHVIVATLLGASLGLALEKTGQNKKKGS